MWTARAGCARGWRLSLLNSKSVCRRSAPRGFTLVETLVVLGVIAAVLAIALPALSAVRRGAHAAASMNNMRQIAAGMRVYSDQHDGILPFFVPGLGAEPEIGRQPLSWAIEELTGGSAEVWIAPADPARRLEPRELPFEPYTSYDYPAGRYTQFAQVFRERMAVRRVVSRAVLERVNDTLLIERQSYATKEPQELVVGQH